MVKKKVIIDFCDGFTLYSHKFELELGLRHVCDVFGASCGWSFVTSGHSRSSRSIATDLGRHHSSSLKCSSTNLNLHGL